jgi:hypothetical protein
LLRIELGDEIQLVWDKGDDDRAIIDALKRAAAAFT